MAPPIDLSKLNICFLAGTLGQGGAERQLFYILKTLRQNGARLRLLSLTRGEFWEEPIKELGVQVCWVGESSSRLMRLKRITNEVNKDRPGVIQSQHSFTNLYAALAGRALGVRSIGAIRTDGKREVQYLGRVAGRLSLRLPHSIAANSKFGIRNAEGLGTAPSRLHLLRNFVDTDYFTPSLRAFSGGVNVAAIGRLKEQKRFDRFLRVMARVDKIESRLGRTIKATITGAGPLKKQLERQAAELGLLGRVVEFKGNLADTRAVYRWADLLVLTSDREGTPNVALEAMATGLPVAATCVGDLPEIIKDGETGLLAEPENEDRMTDNLLKLIRDARLRVTYGLRAREFIVANHSLALAPRLLQHFYQAALQ
ncbi:MAG TPA: glycosyltransferase [Blastocatellia bacterium]|nr:glycosyltransferase [Blastocatellia bacterium]